MMCRKQLTFQSIIFRLCLCRSKILSYVLLWFIISDLTKARVQTHAGQFDAVLMETLSGIFSSISHRDKINLGHFFSITVFDFIP